MEHRVRGFYRAKGGTITHGGGTGERQTLQERLIHDVPMKGGEGASIIRRRIPLSNSSVKGRGKKLGRRGGLRVNR